MTSLRAGYELKSRGADSARWRIVDPIVRDGVVKVFDRQTRAETFELVDEINTNIARQDLILVREDMPRISVVMQADPKLDQRIQMARGWLTMVEGIQRKYKCSFNAAYKTAAGDDGGSPANDLPSRAALYRIRSNVSKDLPVYRGDKNKGNRMPRYSEQVITLIEHAAETLYLIPGSVWDMDDLTRYINQQSHDLGYLPLDKNVSQEFVRQFVLMNVSVDPQGDRMDPKMRAAAKSIGAMRISAALPFDRIEQDGLHVPIIVAVGGHPARNVYLVHAIDCSTGMPTGWHLRIGSPSESDGLKCIESTLYSKRQAFMRLGLVDEIDIDVYGAPKLIVFDNGPETKGQRMLRLARLGINMKHCKSRHPHHKPFIERLNRALKKALQRLPGSTRHDGKDGARDPVELGDSLMTIEELERWIVRWYYQVWAKKELERHKWSDFHEVEKLGCTPHLRLTNVIKRGYPMRLSPALSKWQECLFEHEDRMLNRKTGVSVDGFQYKGANLTYLINKYGEVKVKVLVDPEDYRQVYVFDGEDMPLVPLQEPHVTPETPAYSFAYMKSHPLQPTQPDPATERFNRDMNQQALQAGGARKARNPSSAEQSRLAARAAADAAAVDRAASRPLSSAPRHNPPKAGAEAETAYTFAQDVPELPTLSRSSGEVR